MNIEFSTEQLELQLNPDYDFIPSCFLSQNSKSSQDTTILPAPEEGPLSIITPTPSQLISRADWRFNDPDIPSQSTDSGVYRPEPVKNIMGEILLTPQLTPPRSPTDDDNLVENHQQEALDLLPSGSRDPNEDILSELPQDIPEFLGQDYIPVELLEGLMDPLLSPASQASDDLSLDLFPEMESESMNDNSLHDNSHHESIGEPCESTNQVDAGGDSSTRDETLSPAEPMECSSDKGYVVEPVKPAKANNTKSGRGRKRKTVGKDKEERKRLQNAIAAKKYRERQQERIDQIFQEKKQLEESVAALRRKKQSRMDERNIMLFMVYELAKEKNTLDKFLFPPWLEPLYKKHKEGK